MKKIELHVHLDGSINPKFASELMHHDVKNELIADNCTSLTEYLNKFDLPIKLLQTKENLEHFSYLLAKDLLKDDVIYAEIRFCPMLHTTILSPSEVIDAVLSGLKQVPELKTNLILCMMRNFNMDKNLEIYRLAKTYYGKGVVALDLAGDEARYKTATFKQLFDIIKMENIPFTIHAGEADGPDSVDLAIAYGAKRIGHGIRATESSETLKKLKENNITLELCPTSNLNTRLYPTILAYQIKSLITAAI